MPFWFPLSQQCVSNRTRDGVSNIMDRLHMNCGILYLPTDAGSLGNEAIISRESAGDAKSRIFPSLPFDIIHLCGCFNCVSVGDERKRRCKEPWLLTVFSWLGIFPAIFA
ncbi:hypothetical protein P364_0111215 [Paenibacillus sp. MAEPY2]|nr:hypothetical protein P363_0129300 [Paenibacillus sp. MAEPY1]KGP82937.1 hypothetical protein P364_0111215 [Paenibacillus sp. MAEPY2]